MVIEPASTQYPVTRVQDLRLRCLEWGRQNGMQLAFLDDSMSWRLRGELDPGLLEKALLQVFARHDTLSATYHTDAEYPSPVQVMRPDRLPSIAYTDLEREAGDSPEALLRAATGLLESDNRNRAPLTSAPQLTGRIVRLGRLDHILALFHPSLMMDHWGYNVFAKDLGTAYSALGTGREPEFEECASFASYAQLEYDSLRNGAWDESIEFWSDHYGGRSPIPALSLPGLGDESVPYLAGDRLSGRFTPETATALRSAWAELSADGVTPYGFMLSVLVMLLHAVTGTADPGVLVPAANRGRWEYLETVGLFASILALRFRDIGTRTFAELCATVQETLLDALAHQHVTYHEMIYRLDPEHYGRPMRSPACYFDYWISDTTDSGPAFGDVAAEDFAIPGPAPEQEGMSVVFHDDGTESMTYSIGYAPRILTTGNAHRFAADLERLALAAAAAPHAPVAALIDGSTLTLRRTA